MKRKLLCCVLALLLLSACASAPDPMPTEPDVSLPVQTPDTPSEPSPEPTPEAIPEPTPEATPQPGRAPRERPYSGEPDEAGWIEAYGSDISRPFIYDTLWPAVLQYIKPEFESGIAVNGCDVFRHPQPEFLGSKPEVISTLAKGQHVRVVSRTDSTWHKGKPYDQPWYMVLTSDGQYGWVKVQELEPDPDSDLLHFDALYEYSQGVVVDGCELYFEPNGQPVWALAKNNYVEIIAAQVPEGSSETWLYIHWGSSADFHNCSWVKADEIKPYTPENMYDTKNHVQVRDGALAFFETGKLYEPNPNEILCLSYVEEDGTCWLSGAGGLFFYVESIDDLIWPEPELPYISDEFVLSNGLYVGMKTEDIVALLGWPESTELYWSEEISAGYYILEYEGLVLYVRMDGNADGSVPYLDGEAELVCIQVLDNSVSTHRGMTVGDSATMASELYGLSPASDDYSVEFYFPSQAELYDSSFSMISDDYSRVFPGHVMIFLYKNGTLANIVLRTCLALDFFPPLR